MSNLELCYTCERYGECDTYSRLFSPEHSLLCSCVNYKPTSAKDINIPNTGPSDYNMEIALLELEHRYGKEVRDRVEQIGFKIPKHGHWIEEKLPLTDGLLHQVWRCSECKKLFLSHMRYCGYCGVRMDEVEKE